MPTNMQEQELYQRGHEDMSKGKMTKATSGQGNTTAKGTFTADIDFKDIHDVSTPDVDRQFQHAVITESGGLPAAAPKTGNSKGKKGY